MSDYKINAQNPWHFYQQKIREKGQKLKINKEKKKRDLKIPISTESQVCGNQFTKEIKDLHKEK